jgi:hypothetical protein
MKLLLDENLPHDLRYFLPGHEVFTVTYMGWEGVRNGELLSRAAGEKFDALISMDSGLEYQQNLGELPISVVLLKANSNALQHILPLVPSLLECLQTLPPKTLKRIA